MGRDVGIFADVPAYYKVKYTIDRDNGVSPGMDFVNFILFMKDSFLICLIQ